MLERILTSVNTPGAHILICLCLLVLYSYWSGNPIAHDVTIFALGILSRSMGSANVAGPPLLPPGGSSRTVSEAASTVPAKDPADPAVAIPKKENQ